MTQEEKAKRYDELLLKLQKAKVDDNVCDDRYCCVIDDIVPELEEIEDEEIRKAIHIYLDWLDGRKDYAPRGEYSIHDMIAWLEKQGKQESVNEGLEIPFGAKDSKLQEATYYIPKGFYAGIDGDKVVIKKGEKPAWSEEDKVILDEIIDFFENGTVKLQHDLSLYASWLKSLKDRVGCEVNCTTTKKWSEENITTISRVISIVKWAAYSDHSHPILNDEGATELIERLKSLKDRYTWMPSDEQMEALEHFVRSVGESGYASPYDNNTKLLYSILSDLKKLKG